MVDESAGHTFYSCPKPCPNVGQCMFCDGGIAYCTTCGGYEGALLDECPGIHLTPEQHNWNYEKNMRKWKKQAEEYKHTGRVTP